MTSSKPIVIDLFAGAGGESSGIMSAYNDSGLDVELYAVNHWELALQTHGLNHPSAHHYCEDVFKGTAKKHIKQRRVALLWASPECFVKGTLVLTSAGYTPIEQVSVGDLVLTHKNRWKPVTRVYTHTTAKLCHVKGQGHFGLTTTPEHPFYSKRRTTRYPGKDSKGKRAVVRKMENPYWEKAASMAGHFWATPITAAPLPIPSDCGCELSDEFFYWVGRWLGDGSVSKSDAVISFGNHEISQATAMFEHAPVRTADGVQITPRLHTTRTASNLCWGNAELTRWVVREFGRGAANKRLPGWVFGMQRAWRCELLRGYIAADGHTGDGKVFASSVSKALAVSVRQLALSLGLLPHIHMHKAREASSVIEGRKVNVRDQYSVAWLIETRLSRTVCDTFHAYAPVKSVETSTEESPVPVYNLEVADDESYVAEGIVVHNCTHFSAARGGGPCNPQSRAGMNSVLEWCRDLTVDRVILENVKELLSYGELDADGVPIPERKGRLFEEWWRNMEALGYTLDKRILCAADYGAPTSRERLFIQAVRVKSGKAIVWPEPTHAKTDWVPASSIIDWSDLGVMLQDRKKPLCENTIRRIEHGIRKYWGELAEPYICILRGQSMARSIGEPLPTLTTGQHLGLVVPVDNRSNRGGCLPVGMPVSTITTKQRHGVLQALVMGKHSNSRAIAAGAAPLPTLSTESGPQMISPLIMGQHSGSVPRPTSNSTTPTITTVPHVSLINPLIMSYYGTGSCVDVGSPVPTVTTKQRFGLVVPGQLALSYRMLSAAELAAATGFSKDYRFAGNKTETVKQIGNAVPPAFAYHQVKHYVKELAA